MPHGIAETLRVFLEDRNTTTAARRGGEGACELISDVLHTCKFGSGSKERKEWGQKLIFEKIMTN